MGYLPPFLVQFSLEISQGHQDLSLRQLGCVGRILKDLSAGAAPVRPATAHVRQQGAEAHTVAGDLGKRGAGEPWGENCLEPFKKGTPDPPKVISVGLD